MLCIQKSVIYIFPISTHVFRKIHVKTYKTSHDWADGTRNVGVDCKCFSLYSLLAHDVTTCH